MKGLSPEIRYFSGVSLKPEGNAAAAGPALLLHGLTATPKEMEGLGRELQAGGSEVQIPLLTGHGGDLNELRVATGESWLHDAEQGLASCRSSSVSLCGSSLGGLLALHLAATFPDKVRCAAILSPTLEFHSMVRELVLRSGRILPNFLLNRLGVIKKSARADGALLEPHNAFGFHSIAAGVRLLQVRDRVLGNLKSIRCPILLMVDPWDHHLKESGALRLLDALQHVPVRYQVIPGGQHELLLGPARDKVIELVLDFYKDNNSL